MMRYLAVPEPCVKSDNSSNDLKLITDKGGQGVNINVETLSFIRHPTDILRSKILRKFKNNRTVHPIKNNAFSQFKDSSICETLYLSSSNAASSSTNYGSNTLSNTSLGSCGGIGNQSDLYSEEYTAVRAAERDENDEIVLELQDVSGTLCKTINLDTLSRIDSVCMGKNILKLKYRIPRIQKITPDSHKSTYTKTDQRYKSKKGDYKLNLKNKPKSQKKSVFKIKKSFVRLYGVIILYYSILITAIYLLVCENPLWEGIATKSWRLLYANERLSYGFLIWILVALLNVVPPMFIFFEEDEDDVSERDTSDVALIIPAYKAAKILSKTLRSAIDVFPPQNIFVIANGNSVYPLDNTEEVCAQFNVNHCWVPYGCKLGALYVGVCRVANYKYVVTIDDDCMLPSNFPLPIERFNNGVACIGYTITSCGPNFTKGNIVHKLQDIEYKLSGLMKHFQGKFGGSTMFPHGAVSMWDRKVIYSLFERHPGYRFGEDWFFGHVARELGYRIELCSRVFVKTETPRSMFIAPNTTRGGFGELTVAKQRIFRWNYFLLKCLMDNLYFIIFCWRMPKWYHDVLSKIWVTMEVIQTLQYILLPLIIPLFFTNTYFMLSVTFALMAFSLFMVAMFNFLHLGRKNDARVDWLPVLVFVPYILLCYATNFLSYIWAIMHYGIYYSKKHLRITKIPEVVSMVSGGIDNITRTLQKTMTIAEQKCINGSPYMNKPDPDTFYESHFPRIRNINTHTKSECNQKKINSSNPILYPSPFS